MEDYGNILIIAIPIFLILIIIEKIYGIYKKDDTATLDSVSSSSPGITNAIKDVLGLSLTFLSYEWLVSKIDFYHLEAAILSCLIAFFVTYMSVSFLSTIYFVTIDFKTNPKILLN